MPFFTKADRPRAPNWGSSGGRSEAQAPLAPKQQPNLILLLSHRTQQIADAARRPRRNRGTPQTWHLLSKSTRAYHERGESVEYITLTSPRHTARSARLSSDLVSLGGDGAEAGLQAIRNRPSYILRHSMAPCSNAILRKAQRLQPISEPTDLMRTKIYRDAALSRGDKITCHSSPGRCNGSLGASLDESGHAHNQLTNAILCCPRRTTRFACPKMCRHGAFVSCPGSHQGSTL